MQETAKTVGRLKTARLARMADRVSVLVLREDYPQIDVVLALENLRRAAEEMFPGSGELFEMIYVARVRRLWEQFRATPWLSAS